MGTMIAGSCAGAYALALHIFRPPNLGSPTAQEPGEFEIGGVIVSGNDLDLGEMWETDAFACSLPLLNSTDSQQRITDFQTSCGCLQVEPRVLTILPHQTATVRLKLDLSHRGLEETGRAERPFAVEVKPLLKTTWTNEPGWRLHGIVKSYLTLDATALHFGETIVQGQKPATRKLTAILHSGVQRLLARVEPAVASVEIAPSADNPNRRQLLVRPSETLPVGPFKGTVILDIVDSSGQTRFGARLPIAGEVRPEMCPLPAQLFLGAHPIGSTAESTVVLQAAEGTAWTVDHVETESRDVRVEAIAVEGVASGRAFRVRQQVAKVGDQSSQIRFVVRKLGHAPTTLETRVFYFSEAATKEEARKP